MSLELYSINNSIIPKSSLSSHLSPARNLFGKSSRTILPVSLAPSIQQSDEHKINKTSDEESIKYHAFQRIHAFAVTAVIISGIAKRSHLQEPRNITLEIGSATLQVGQGSKGYHAAHDNAGSGYKDNFRSIIMKQIGSEKKITPKTERILKCKGFTDEQLDQILKNCDNLTIFNQLFNKIWPADIKKPHSLISGTSIEIALNSTTETPARVNLVCDNTLEKHIRPQMLELYHLLTLEEVSPEEACKKYVEIIHAFFLKSKISITEKITLLKNYKDQLEFLKYPNKFDVKKIVLLLKEIQKLLKTSPTSINIKKNLKFLKQFSIKTEESSYYKIFRAFTKKVTALEDLIEEAKEKILSLNSDLKFYSLQKEGTEMIDFTTLFGEFCEIEKTRTLSPETLSTIQKNLLKPMDSSAILTTPPSSPRK